MILRVGAFIASLAKEWFLLFPSSFDLHCIKTMLYVRFRSYFFFNTCTAQFTQQQWSREAEWNIFFIHSHPNLKIFFYYFYLLYNKNNKSFFGSTISIVDYEKSEPEDGGDTVRLGLVCYTIPVTNPKSYRRGGKVKAIYKPFFFISNTFAPHLF